MRPKLTIPKSEPANRQAEIRSRLAPRLLHPTYGSPVLERRGLTLIELVLAVAILSLSVVALGMMGRAVQISSEYGEGYGTATQHARVALNRIRQVVNDAYGTGAYCGVWSVNTTVGSTNYPETLVVWRPGSSGPANPAGPPLAQELVLYCPDSGAPNRLLEITVPGVNTALPSSDSTTPAFKTFIDGLKSSLSAVKTPLTDLVRATNGRGGVRFTVTLNPSASEWSSYPATTSWSNLPWVQGIVGPEFGMRQVWTRTELQMVPYGQWVVTNPTAEQVIPYFGSAAFCYTLTP